MPNTHPPLSDLTPVVVKLISQHGPEFFEHFARHLPGGALSQGDIEFVTDLESDADVIVVRDYFKYDSLLRAREGYFWRWDTEPLVQNPFPRGFDKVFTHLDSGLDSRAVTAPPVLDWWVNKSYDELKTMPIPKKVQDLSVIASTKDWISGHRLRASFVSYLEQQAPDADFFGFGRQKTLDDKWDGLAPYRYSVAVENTSKNDYWSEKISDCFLSYTVPFYFGATNIEKYFPPQSFVWIPIDQPARALEIIRETMSNPDWSARLPALQEAREKILDEFSLGGQILRRVRSEREDILKAPRVSRAVHGRRTKPGGWIHGIGVSGNIRARIKRRQARQKA